MKNSEQRLTCAQAREIDLVDYLKAAGHEPHRIRNYDYWYLSPLRGERTASFKVNRKLNRWYDHGLGRGGNLIDFAILYHNSTIAEFLQTLQGNFSFHKPALHQTVQTGTENRIKILGDFMISSFSLLNYLEQRKIPFEIADRICREVRYQIDEKIYYAIGFKNDAGGYELRNSQFKSSSAPKDITTFKNGAGKIAVFEGFFDVLSFLVLYQNQQPFVWDFCILNSLSFFEKTRSFLDQYEFIHLFLDNDEAGQNCSRSAVELCNRWIDESYMYQPYKDLNEWLVAIRSRPP